MACVRACARARVCVKTITAESSSRSVETDRLIGRSSRRYLDFYGLSTPAFLQVLATAESQDSVSLGAFSVIIIIMTEYSERLTNTGRPKRLHVLCFLCTAC